MLLFLATAAHAACTFDADTALLATNIEAAQQAYVSLDVPEFQRAMTEVDYLLPCLTDAVPPKLAAELHRIRAIGQYVDGKPDAVAASLRAARTLDPGYVFPSDLLPEGFELRVQYEAIEPVVVETVRLPRPSRGTTLLVDGVASQERPPHATVLQVRTDDAIASSSYLLPGDALPDYPGVDRRRSTLLTGALITGAASLVLYGGAWVSYANLEGATNADELQRGTRRTHVLMLGSGVLFAGGLAQVGLLAANGRQR